MIKCDGELLCAQVHSSGVGNIIFKDILLFFFLTNNKDDVTNSETNTSIQFHRHINKMNAAFRPSLAHI